MAKASTREDSLPEWLTVCDEIDDGEHDEGLLQIMRAVESRREVTARRNARRLMRVLVKGDRVIITNDIKPRFYEGMVGTVRQLRDAAAVIMLDELPSGRGRTPTEERSKRLLVPFIHLVKLEEDDIRAVKADKADPKEAGDDSDDMEEVDDDD